MKNISRIFVLVLTLLFATFTQLTTGQTGNSSTGQSGNQSNLTISQSLDFWVTNTETEVVSAAVAMPEEKYSFAPSASTIHGGEFTKVRTFAQQLKHLAANNYRMAAYIVLQTPTPDQENETGPATIRTKAQIVNYVKGSFAALHRAVATINEKNMLEDLAAMADHPQNNRVQLAVDSVAHSYDHYGQLVEYLRMNGIIPPASHGNIPTASRR